jgi:hypothetical protein
MVRSRFSEVYLEQEQGDLLAAMVEAERNLPREQRHPFILSETFGGGSDLVHAGFGGRRHYAYRGDLETLAESGLLRMSFTARATPTFDITPEGRAYYEEMKAQAGEPIERLEAEVRRYLVSDDFRKGHPDAYARWAAAEELLWASDSNKQFTDVGHRCREAMQRLATDLVDRDPPPNVDPDPAHTVARLRAAIAQANLGDSVGALLDALVRYWGTVSDVVQRQEHGDQRSDPLVWEDARRVVFQTAQVMFELSKSLP